MPTEKKVQFNRSMNEDVANKWVKFCKDKGYTDNDHVEKALLKYMKGE